MAEELRERLNGAKAVFGLEYSGLTVQEMESIRNEVKAAGDRFNVVKNRILIKAVEGSKWESIKEVASGPLAYSLSFSDPVALAKILVAKAREFENLKPKFGMLEDGKLLNEQQVRELSRLPSREVLLAQVLSAMNGPVSGFVNVLAANLRNLLYVLKAIEGKKKES